MHLKKYDTTSLSQCFEILDSPLLSLYGSKNALWAHGVSLSLIERLGTFFKIPRESSSATRFRRPYTFKWLKPQEGC